jgi:transposase
LTRSSQAAAGHVQRARIVLLAAEGMPNAAIGRQVGVSTPTVLAWRNRYHAGGIDALADLDRSGRPPVIDDVAVVVRTLDDDGRPPAQLGVTHWSARLLAEQLRREGVLVSFATVARIWRKWGLQPHRRETFTFATDPRLEAKLRDVVGLYLEPPANAVVVCVDEKSQVQALDRTAPILLGVVGHCSRRNRLARVATGR